MARLLASPRPRWLRPDRVALGGAVLTGAGLALTAPRPVMPPFLPIGPYASYGPDSPMPTIAFDALLHAPWLGTREVLLSAVVAAAVMATLWRACCAAGGAAWAALAVVLVVAVRPDTGVAVALTAPPALALAAVWFALAAAGRNESPRGSMTMMALTIAAAMAFWLPALVLVPLLVGRACDVARRMEGVAATVAAAAFGAAIGGWLATSTASSMLGVSLSGADLWRAVTATPSPPAGTYPWPPLAVMGLPLALMLVGAAGCWRRATRPPWGSAAGLALSLVVAASVAAWRAELQRAIIWAAWPLVAPGLTWVVAQASPHRRRIAAVVMAALLIGSSAAARLRQTDLVEPAAFAAALSHAVERRPLPLTVVVEDPRVDTALVAWGGPALRRLAVDPAHVARAAEGGAAVLAGPTARAALEMHGLRFRPGATVAAPVAFELAEVAGRFRCVAVGTRWSELSGLEFTGRLGVHVPQGQGQLEVVVTGVAPLAVSAATPQGRRIGTVTVAPARDLDSLPPVLWPGDGRLPPPDTLAARVVVPASTDYDIDQGIALGARAPLVAARMVGASVTASVCAAPLPRFDPFDGSAADVTLPLGDAVHFAAGFHGVEGQGAQAFRWTEGRAVVLVPSAGARAVTLQLDARPAAASAAAPVMLDASVNGVPLGRRTMSSDTASYEWSVPATVWVDGTSEILLAVSRTAPPSERDRRALGLAVYGLRLTRR